MPFKRDMIDDCAPVQSTMTAILNLVSNFFAEWINSNTLLKSRVSDQLFPLSEAEWTMPLISNFTRSELLTILQSEPCKSGLRQKYAFIKKSTIFTQSLRKFVKVRYSWGPYFDKVSRWLGKNCRFFNKSIFLPKSGFAWFRLYMSASR